MRLMAAQDRTVEARVARIASRAHGVVTRAQMSAAGITRDEIAHRVAVGALIRVHPGVYRVGHRAPSVEATYLAAVLACGEGAVLSGRAAGYLWRILKDAPPWPEVLTPTERRIEGIVTHRSRAPIRATRWKGVPVTTVPRTLVDLAAHLSLGDLAHVCHEAGVIHKTTPAQVVRAMRP